MKYTALMRRIYHILVFAVICILTWAGSVQGQSVYSYTFTSQQWNNYGDATLDGVTWTAQAGSGGDFFSFSTNKGQQFGAAANPCRPASGNSGVVLSLSTSGIRGYISKIEINTSGANNTSGVSISASVGGQSLLSITHFPPAQTFQQHRPPTLSVIRLTPFSVTSASNGPRQRPAP